MHDDDGRRRKLCELFGPWFGLQVWNKMHKFWMNEHDTAAKRDRASQWRRLVLLTVLGGCRKVNAKL